VARHGISVERAAWLVDAYGTRAEKLLEFCLKRPDDVPLQADCWVTSAEIAYLARNELVVGLEDMLLRRTPLAIRGEVSTALISSVATAMAKELGWNAERQAQEVETVIGNLATYHGVSLEMLEQRTHDRSTTCV
jgi:glycerol-3-phosphate dehydrogenase